MTNNKLKVAVTPSAPFVIETNNKYSGFEIELWEEIAKEIGLDYEYQKHNFQELIPLVVDKKVDIAIGAITINEKREEMIDFSHPIFHSGLRILLSKNRSKINFVGTIKAFLTQGYKKIIKPIFIFLLIIFLFGSILWTAEKGGGSFSSNYIPGIFQATWISVSAIIGSYGGMFIYELHTWYGRLILTLIRIASLAALGLFIGEIAAFITTRKIRLNIEGPDDLKGKIVATVGGTTSESVLKKLSAIVHPVIKIGEAYEKLNKGEVDAVVFDAPVLIYDTANNKNSEFEIVSELFDKQDYGLVLQDGSILRESVNRAVLLIQESGYYDTLYKKWFGENK